MKILRMTVGAVVVGAVALFLYGSACQRTPNEPDLVRPGYRQLTLGPHKVAVRVVADNEKRRKGLMHVRKLPEDDGMLFVFREKQVLSFWMKNTLIPLDIAYLEDDGTIVDIIRMDPDPPGTPDGSRKRYPGSKELRYALELNVGWFQRHGISVGDRVEGLPTVEEVKAQ